MTTTITDILSRIQKDKEKLGITLYESASEEDISLFERTKGIRLPDDLRLLYSVFNGFESEEDMFRIIPLDEIIVNKHNSYTVGENDFFIAEYMIYCDTWTIAIDPKNSNSYSIYNKAETVVTLTNSFSKFLETFLDGGVFNGLYNWRQEIEQNSK